MHIVFIGNKIYLIRLFRIKLQEDTEKYYTLDTQLVIFFLSLVGVNVFKILVILEKISSEVEDCPGNDFLLDGETNIEVNGECGSVLVRHFLSRVSGNGRRGEEVEEGIYFDFLGEGLVRGLGT